MEAKQIVSKIRWPRLVIKNVKSFYSPTLLRSTFPVFVQPTTRWFGGLEFNNRTV